MNIIALVDELSGRDITKHEQIYEMNYIYALDCLVYRRHADEVNAYHMEQQQRKKK